jgi:spondin N
MNWPLVRRLALSALAVSSVTCGGSGSLIAPSPAQPSPTPGTPPPIVAAAAARYVVTFETSWSRTTHPTDFPSNPHFSPLIGVTHAAGARFWSPGATASDGIEAMAERGATSPLDQEMQAAIAGGAAFGLIRGAGIGRSPGSTSVEFEIRRDHPLVTLVSMVAPTPDWFTGVHDLSLIENGDWVGQKLVVLYPYDAGTDSGVTYESADEDTQPRRPIRQIDGFPFAEQGRVAPIATFDFRRLPN